MTRFDHTLGNGRNKRSVISFVLLTKIILLLAGTGILGWLLFFGKSASAETDALKNETASAGQPYVMEWTAICENVMHNQPVNPGVVFSAARKKIYCFSAFEDVRKQTAIYHNWIRKDELVAQIKLLVQPPSWSTSSSLHFRDSDQGPWRVEITDEAGKVLNVLRFSIVE